MAFRLRCSYYSTLLRQGRGVIRLQQASTLAVTPLPSSQVVTRSPNFNTPVRPPPQALSRDLYRSYTTEQSSSQPAKPKSSTERIKVILKEYGPVAIVFHTCISLCSLGTCYLLVSNGLDVNKVFEYFNVSGSTTTKGASTFAIAYVLHKVFLPLRAAITVGGVPLIVRKLRSMGWMKGVAKTRSK